MTNKTSPMLLIDFYKAVHAEMLPKNITKSVSYFTPSTPSGQQQEFTLMENFAILH